MSPEINGNPPSVTKRKKNREKKTQPLAQSSPTMNPLDFNMSTNCNYFPPDRTGTYHHPQNVSIPDMTHYYSFLNYSNPSEPMSLPIYPIPSYYPNYNHHPTTASTTTMGVPKLTLSTPNGDGSTEYLSLPVGTLDGSEDSSKRRYSDPGLPNDSDSSCSTPIENQVIQKLSHQVHILRESNKKLTRDVMEMRIELNLLKQQQNSRHYDREYEPGMLADIIREVRDAARVREDALLARVKHMIEEKQLSMNHLQLVNDKNRSNDRISKLEEQLKSLSVCSGPSSTSNRSEENHHEDGGTARQILDLEREALELRRELQDTRARKEEADLKLMQLDKKLTSIKRRNDISTSDDDGKTNSIDTNSVTTSASSSITQPPRVTLSGPVTDL